MTCKAYGLIRQMDWNRQFQRGSVHDPSRRGRRVLVPTVCLIRGATVLSAVTDGLHFTVLDANL